jgi:hypothetical protein
MKELLLYTLLQPHIASRLSVPDILGTHKDAMSARRENVVVAFCSARV